MISKKIINALNKQIEMEAYASYSYLAMASWCDSKGYNGCADFLYKHSEEERTHMLKLFHYINEAGGQAITPAVKQAPKDYKSIKDMFDLILKSEQDVTMAINNLVSLCVEEHDHSTNNFLQWYVAEQHEEETLLKTIIDKINLLGEDSNGNYWIDKEVGALAIKPNNSTNSSNI